MVATQVLSVLGPNHLEAMMGDILEGAVSRASPSMREGHLVLMHYLPITMGAHFQSSLQVRGAGRARLSRTHVRVRASRGGGRSVQPG